MMIKMNYAEEVILRCFFPEGEKKTIKEIQNRSNYSYERANTTLKSLKEKKIIIEENIGKTLIYSLNHSNLYSRWAFYGYMIKKLIEFEKNNPKLNKALKEIEWKDFEMIILFGSYARSIETKQSDIDLMIVTTHKKKMEGEISHLKRKYNLPFSPVFVSSWDFLNIKKKNPELWGELKNNGKVFGGENWFYHWMYQNENN